MVKRRGRRRTLASLDAAPHTIPLFEESEEASRHSQRIGTPRAVETVMHVYWSASLEAHNLGAVALAAQHPDQKRALLELAALEHERQKLAQRLLAEVWRVRIGTNGSPANSGLLRGA